jgi:hypothetical protein
MCDLFVPQALHMLSDRSGQNAGGAYLLLRLKRVACGKKNILEFDMHTGLTVRGAADFIKMADA